MLGKEVDRHITTTNIKDKKDKRTKKDEKMFLGGEEKCLKRYNDG